MSTQTVPAPIRILPGALYLVDYEHKHVTRDKTQDVGEMELWEMWYFSVLTRGG